MSPLEPDRKTTSDCVVGTALHASLEAARRAGGGWVLTEVTLPAPGVDHPARDDRDARLAAALVEAGAPVDYLRLLPPLTARQRAAHEAQAALYAAYARGGRA